MSYYELLVTLHVISVIVWLGAAFMLTLLILRADLARDAIAKAELNAQSDWLAPRLFIPSALGTLVFGILLVIEGPWSLDMLWVSIALGGWIASFLTGILYFKTEGERLVALVEQHGPDHVDVQRRLDRMEAVGRVELALLFLIVADMIAKPTGDDTGFLIAGLLLLIGAAVGAFSALGAQARRAA